MKTINNEKKIELNTCYDLYKTPINILKSTKIYNFKGKYFDKIYEEALKVEKSGSIVRKPEAEKALNFEKIQFEIFYSTEFGQRIKPVGSIEELGNWNPYQTKGLDLHWNTGNIWKGEIPFKTNFEFKFVFLQNDKVSKWESGENRIFDMKNLNDKIKVDKLDKDGKIVISQTHYSYEYDRNTSSLKIKCFWRN